MAEWEQTDPPVNADDAVWSPPAILGKGVPGDQPEPEPLQVPDAESRELGVDELPIPGVHWVMWEDKEWAVVRRVGCTEQQHVSDEAQQTRDYVRVHDVHDLALTDKGSYVDVPVEGRLTRAARYASWRYRGYLAGEVSSL